MLRARQVAAATGILAYISGFVGSLALGSNQPGAADSVPAANTVDQRVLATAVLRDLTILELFPWAAFFAGVAVVSLTRRALPGWLGWSSVILAVLDLAVAAWSGLTGVNASLDVQSFIPAFLAIYFLPQFWMVAASVVLLRRELTRPAAVSKTSPATSV